MFTLLFSRSENKFRAETVEICGGALESEFSDLVTGHYFVFNIRITEYKILDIRNTTVVFLRVTFDQVRIFLVRKMR